MKKTKLTLYGILIGYLSLVGMIGCAAIPKKAGNENELRYKIDDWKEQLYSNDPSVRSAAAVSLLGSNLHKAQEPLIRILNDDKASEDVKVSVIKAFGFMKDDRATDFLINLLNNESAKLQTAASEALGELKTRNSIQKMSVAMLNPLQPLHAKMLLAEAFGNTNNREAVEPLIKVLMMDDRGLKDVAKKSLEKITKQPKGNNSVWWKEWWGINKTKTQDQWLEDIVLKQAENTKQLETQIAKLKLEMAQKTIKLLEVRADKSDPKPLIDAVKSDYHDVRIFAAKELANIKDPSVIDALVDATSDSQEEVRIEVVQTLGEIGDERAVKPLIYALDDESLLVREKAAKALGQLGKPESAEALISALSNNSTNLSIMRTIIDALGQIGDIKAVEPLISLLHHKESKIRECTAASLGKIHDERAVKPLIAALLDEQERVRWYSADSLGKIGDPACVEPLVKLLSDNSARVRESAVTALGQIGNQQAIESLIKALQDVDKRVTEQAAESLVNIKKMEFEVMDTLATTFYTNKDYKRAGIILEKQIAKYSKQPELNEKILQTKVKLAKILLTIKDWQKALSLYEEVVKQSSRDDTIKKDLIQCLKEIKQYDRALEWYAIWTKEIPQNNQVCWEGRLDIANALLDQGKYENVKSLIDNLKAEDINLGGEKFKSQFRELGERCLSNLADSNRIGQLGVEQTFGFDDKE